MGNGAALNAIELVYFVGLLGLLYGMARLIARFTHLSTWLIFPLVFGAAMVALHYIGRRLDGKSDR